MKRRSFLKTAAATTPIITLGGAKLQAGTSLEMLAQMPQDNDRILVIIQLFGGNDGLNTIVPVNDDNYFKLRPNIGVKKTEAYAGLGDVYLHPSLAKGDTSVVPKGMAGMLETGSLAIVQGIGYENPNLSHFRSTDIWLSGLNISNPDVRLDTGWVGRTLEKMYPDFPASLPPHPLAVQFSGFSLALLSSKGRMGIEVADPSAQKGVGSSVDELDPLSNDTNYKLEYDFVADIAKRSNQYAQAVKDAYAKGKDLVKGWSNTSSLGTQMQSVAALIAGGLKTKVYVVSMGGFDTHYNQQQDVKTGLHPTLLERISDSVAQFNYHMTKLGHVDKIVGITVSEFGRRPQENGSYGTDHGAASVQFVWGKKVNGGVFGNSPDLKNFTNNGDLRYQIDYRRVYAEIITEWFGLTLKEARTVLQDDSVIPIDVLQTPSGVQTGDTYINSLQVKASPSPFSNFTNIEFFLDKATEAQIEIHSPEGRRVAVIANQYFTSGMHKLNTRLDLPQGAYMLTLRAMGKTATQMVHCQK